jgi:membrane associated rhomboid family serine protease
MLPLRDSNRSHNTPIVTWVIIAANILVFLYELTLSQNDLQLFTQSFALIPARFETEPLYFAITLFSSMFMHAGWFHLLSNMWILFIFGDNIEDRMGPVQFLIFYVISGLAAGLLQVIVSPGSQIPIVGASGAIAGVLGGYIFLYPNAKVDTLVTLGYFIRVIEVSAVFFLGIWFVTQLFSGIASIGATGGGVAWWAHIGGFLMGFAICALLVRRGPSRGLSA